MTTNPPVVTPQFLAEGAPAEQIAAELAKLYQNVADPNTDAKAVRRVTVEISVKPNERRDSAEIEITAKSKLPGLKPTSSTWYFGIRDGRQVAVQHDPRQMELDVEPAGPVEVSS